MMKEKYTITDKRIALAAAHQIMTRYRPQFKDKRFCGDANFGIDKAINIISALYEQAIKREENGND